MLPIGQATVSVATQTLTRGQRSSSSRFTRWSCSDCCTNESANRYHARKILAEDLGHGAGPTNRTVDNFIVKLRKKVERHPDKPEHILTVYGFGYKLAP